MIYVTYVPQLPSVSKRPSQEWVEAYSWVQTRPRARIHIKTDHMVLIGRYCSRWCSPHHTITPIAEAH